MGLSLQDRLLAVSGVSVVSDRRLARSLRAQGDPEAAAMDIAGRLHTRLFAGIAEADTVAGALAAEAHHVVPVTIDRAGHVMHHEFDLLGSGPTALGSEIDWHTDFKSGHSWPADKWHGRLDLGNLDRGYDVKVPWELSRLQHLTSLARAHAHTHDPAYQVEFCRQVESWLAHNPPGMGVNWACAMDVAIRAANLLWAWAYFSRWAVVPGPVSRALLGSMLAHGVHITRNLEGRPGGVNSNHYLSDVCGLLFIALALPELRESETWASFAIDALEQECEAQTLPDGANQELSTSYHRLVCELFIAAGIMCRRNGRHMSSTYWSRVHDMLEYTYHYTRRDGSAPLVGDVDNGRLFRLHDYRPVQREFSDHRHLLAVGSVLFEEVAWGNAAGAQWEEAFWLLGSGAVEWQKSLERNAVAGTPRSALHADAGVAILRTGDSHCTFTIGGEGRPDVSGHQHNDCLGLEIRVGEKTLLVDPGTYVYTADIDERNRYRSTGVHSTIQVDDAEINSFDPSLPFEMECEARPRVTRWSEQGGIEVAAGRHFGYTRLKDPAVVHRAVAFDRDRSVWVIRDWVEALDEHVYHIRFHVPWHAVSWDDDTRSLSIFDKAELLAILHVLDAPDMSVSLLPSKYAPAYGYVRDSTIVSFRVSARGRVSVTWGLSLLRLHPPDVVDVFRDAMQELGPMCDV